MLWTEIRSQNIADADCYDGSNESHSLLPLATSQDFAASRREAVAAGTAVVLASLLNVAPAQAFLGFGEGKQRETAYKDETVSYW